VLTKDYEEKPPLPRQSKQSQTKPISGKANVKMGKIFWTQRAGAGKVLVQPTLLYIAVE